MNQHSASVDIYQSASEQIIKAIENGAGKWKLPWHQTELPINIRYGQSNYNWLNSSILWMSQVANNFDSNIWGTTKAWENKGANVRLEETRKGTTIFKFYPKKQNKGQNIDQNNTELGVGQTTSVVYNTDQVDGFERNVSEDTDLTFDIDHVKTFVANTKAEIRHGGDEAYYDPKTDYIQLPDKYKFQDTSGSSANENYYGALLHELIHWSGNKHRCDRSFSKYINDSNHAFEELIAELGSTFLCIELGVIRQPRKESFNYISFWLEQLHSDKHYYFRAAKSAVQAVRFLISLQGD